MADQTLSPAVGVVTLRRSEIAIYQLNHELSDMTEIAAKAHVDVAKMTYAIPARHESIQTMIVVAGAIGGAAILHLLGVPKEVILAALAVFGLPATIGKIRKVMTAKKE